MLKNFFRGIMKKMLINSEDNKWDIEISSILGKLPLHFSRSYHLLMMSNGDGEPFLFKYTDAGKILLIPFLKRYIRKINKKRIYDIQSVYGYTGPISNSRNEYFLKTGFREFNKYCIENNIISELIRFNPIINNHLIINNNDEYELTKVKPYVILNLSKDINTLKLKYKKRLRGYINKAEKEFNNLVKFTKDKNVLNSFYELYRKHMKYLGVENYYYMSEPYFSKLTKMIEKQGFLAYSELDGRIIAGLIFLSDSEVSYYVHGARDVNIKENELINKFLFHKSFEFEIMNGMKKIFLGGGVSNKCDDNLFRFKKKFGGEVTTFYMGKRIHHLELYNKIVDIWEKEHPNLIDKYGKFIDKYWFTN
jgi:hypothetical protein